MLKTSILLTALLTLVAVNQELRADCRNPAIKHQFDVKNGFAHGRKGYVVDHICALACGGIDSISNMQYQTISESKAKDRWETTTFGCKKTCNQTNSTPTRQVFNCV